MPINVLQTAGTSSKTEAAAASSSGILLQQFSAHKKQPPAKEQLPAADGPADPEDEPNSSNGAAAGVILKGLSQLFHNLLDAGRIPESMDFLKIHKHVRSPPPLIQGSVRKEAAVRTYLNQHGMGPEKEKSVRRLYDSLDLNNDGTIDIEDLEATIKHELRHIPHTMAPQILQRIGKRSVGSKNEGAVNFAEFAQYVVEQEERLERIFNALDRNKDGLIDVHEIEQECLAQDLAISHERIRSLVKLMDQTGNAKIDLNEFKTFLLLYPINSLRDVADFWRHNLVIDIGEDSQIPEDFTPAEMRRGVWWKHLVAGAMAGAMSRTFTAPLDRLKVFLQVHCNSRTKYGVFAGTKHLYMEGGLWSFWRGNLMNVMKIAPESALKFAAYEQAKRTILKHTNRTELTVYDRFAAGSIAGAFSQTVIYPLEVLKTRLALRKTGECRTIAEFAVKMYHKEGLSCFYKGFWPNLCGIIPYAGIDLAVYETLKKWYCKKVERKEPGIHVLLGCGMLSSTCGQVCTYPFALVRTRLQARAVSNDPNQPDSALGQVRYILRNEGVPGLYRGIVPNFFKVIPAVGISWVVYEHSRKFLGATMT